LITQHADPKQGLRKVIASMDRKTFQQTTEERLEHSRSFRTIAYLCLFGLAITIPLVLLFGALLLQSASVQRAQMESRVSQVRDALVSDIDREFDRDITILHTLATSEALADEDWPAFYKQAKAGLQGRAYLVLIDAKGRQLVNTYVPYGKQPALTGDPETLRRIVETRTSVVSNLFTSLVVKKPVFNISIPIVQDNKVRYVMSLGLLPDDVSALLNAQKLGPEWVTLIWDSNGVLLARSQDNSRFVGKRLPQNMREKDQRTVVRTTNLDGIDVLHATARSQLSDWGIGVNVPYSVITQQMRNSLLLWGVAAILAITIALVLGLFFARPITTSLSAAARAAAAVGEGEPFALTGSRLKEADEFLITLRNAQRARQELMEELKRSRDWLQTTLSSIGDAVIATDANGMITFMNPVAEKLTGWALQEAQGKPLAEVFQIVNEQTGQAVENPVNKVRRLNRVVGLANHTVLISRNAQEIAIDDSGAPIFAPDGSLAGVVLVFRDVTEQRQAEKAAAHLAAIVEFSGDGIITKNLDGIIQTWNTGAERLLGYNASEIVGKSAFVLFPSDRQREEDEILQRLREGTPSERLETIRVSKDGRPIRVSIGVSPIKDAEGRIIGASKVIHDITELAAAREALVLEKEFLATTLASIGDAVIATDADGRITLMNPVAEELTEWRFEDVKGKPFATVFRIVNQDTRETVESPVDKVRRVNKVVGLANHTILISKTGREVSIDDSGAPIRDQNGAIVGIVLIFRDVTRQRALETALRLNERMALAGRLSASIAHEIHNPIDAVSHVLFLLGQRLDEQADVQRLVAIGQNEVQRVAEISKNMLSLHRESRTSSVVNISELLEEVVALIEETISKGRRNIEISSGLGGRVEAFPSELRQVFTNVIKNAVEATDDGGEIKIFADPAVDSGREGVIIRVVDDGIGISEQVRSRLFNPFVSTKEESGTGLGLWVSRSIVERHGGNMRLENRETGRGAVVSTFLPLRAGSRKDSDHNDESQAPTEAAG
jgi:PAS domain S-box-containing protein